MIFDSMNTVEVNNLITYGVLGTHYTVQNGHAVATPEQFDLFMRDRHDLDQLQTFNLNINPAIPRLMTQHQMDAANAIRENSERYVACVSWGLVSETLTRDGPALQRGVADAKTMYIMGQLDETGWRAAVADWFSRGGDRICAELTASYNTMQATR